MASGSTSNSSLSPFAAAYLDAVRFLAALIVVFGHVQGLFFVALPEAHTPLSKLYYSMAARSHDAVMLFFILSGLLITVSAARVFRDKRNGWCDYAIARAARLYTVLIPALLLGACWDTLGLHLFGDHYGTSDVPVLMRHSMAAFFGNLFFLQEILVPSFGSNQPLWSLAYEAWYYVMFPLVMLVLLRSSGMRQRWCATLMLVVLFSLVGQKISSYFLIWLMGSAIFFLPPPRFCEKKTLMGIMLAVTLGLMVVSIFVARKKLFPLDEAGLAPDIVVGFFMATHLWAVRHAPLAPVRIPTILAARGASFSFTMYVCHYPFLLFLSFVLLGQGPWHPDVQHMVDGIALVMCAVLYSAWIARLFEAKTPAVTARLRSWLA